jgi:hypothetical protein
MLWFIDSGGGDITGRIVLAEGASKPPLEHIKIRMIVTGDIQFADEWPPSSPDSEGRFHFANRPITRVQITVFDLPANFDVKEIRYNGSAVTDNIIALNAKTVVKRVASGRAALTVQEAPVPLGRQT